MTFDRNLFAGCDVSRETLDRLSAFEALLRKWNPAINLVSRSSLENLWERHFLDSAQIFGLAPTRARRWVDIGSGGGFPGLIAAILAVEARPELHVTLIESDKRKCAFLTNSATALGLSLTVLPQRAEAIAPLSADVVTARAVAPLNKLLEYAEMHLCPDGVAVFPKGANYRLELDQALESWTFTYQRVASLTDPNAAILSIGGIARV